MDEFVIQTDGLTKRYKNVVAVDDLSMEMRRGRVYGLLGPNASGKTTIMGLLLGLLRPSSGTFSLFGSRDGHEESLRRVGAIIESPSFYPYLSGLQNLKYFQIISGGGSEGELESLIDRVGLAGRSDDLFRTYSLGMKQRLGIAYALLGDPDLVFLDEPTNGLDPEGMIEVRELIRSLGDGNRTVLLSSHLLHEVEQVCDSVTIISKGRLIAQGEVSQLVAMAGSEQIRTKTTDNSKARQILSALDWVEDVDTHEDSLLVTAPIERSSELTAALARSEVYVAEMVPVRRSLEEYFLEVTGHGEAIPQ
ncbi:ATP-binding cassette domain-containing protein [SAR202 cluster bacterium AD-804-J14_MRT_500m]|nr:ATP-binding cassette domain-containing protein [SAR202 cluster bacterium AD-804-J14_MRT_500m]